MISAAAADACGVFPWKGWKKSMANNLDLYEALKTVPPDAQKPITGGRLSGMTDINAMWRIKRLTEMFGPCGIGWKTENEKYFTMPGADGAVAAFCELDLLYFWKNEWSSPIHGIGGSFLVAKETKGLYTDDEAFKKARTDALGVAAKMIGLGGSIYWQSDNTKYLTSTFLCENCKSNIIDSMRRDKTIWPAHEIVIYSLRSFGKILCPDCIKKEAENQDGGKMTFKDGKIEVSVGDKR